MRYAKRFIILIAACSIGACAALRDDTRSVEYTCAAATELLNTATTLKAKLSPEQQATVTRAVNVLNPICSAPNAPSADKALIAASALALVELTKAVEAAQK